MALALFVYGTLMPGHLRWPMLAKDSIDHQPARAPGRLFDTGWGWPAARFTALGDDAVADAGAMVPGWLVLLSPADDGALLGELDAMEGIADPPSPTTDPYVRGEVVVSLESGGTASGWAYHATTIDPRWQAIARWHGHDER